MAFNQDGLFNLELAGIATPHPERCRDRPRPVYRLDDVKAVEG